MLILWTTTAAAWTVAGLLVARAIRLGDDGMGERPELGPGQASAGRVVVAPRERRAALVDARDQLDAVGEGRGEAAARAEEVRLSSSNPSLDTTGTTAPGCTE